MLRVPNQNLNPCNPVTSPSARRATCSPDFAPTVEIAQASCQRYAENLDTSAARPRSRLRVRPVIGYHEAPRWRSRPLEGEVDAARRPRWCRTSVGHSERDRRDEPPHDERQPPPNLPGALGPAGPPSSPRASVAGTHVVLPQVFRKRPRADRGDPGRLRESSTLHRSHASQASSRGQPPSRASSARTTPWPDRRSARRLSQHITLGAPYTPR